MLKQLGCLTLSCIAALLAGLAFHWRQSTHLPQWYTSEQSTYTSDSVLTQDQIDDPKKLQHLKTQLNQQVEVALTQKFPKKIPPKASRTPFPSLAHAPGAESPLETVRLDASDFNTLLATTLAERIDRHSLLGAVKAVHTDIQAGTMTSGIVVDFNQVPVEKLSPQHQSMVDNLQQALPLLSNREIYLEIEGKPTLEKGHLTLNNRMHIAIGGLKFKLADIANRLEIPISELERPLSLKLGRLRVQNITFEGRHAVFQGTVQP